MNKKLLFIITILSVVFGYLGGLFEFERILESMVFPFSIIAEFLRNLSLGSTVGNILSIIIYVIFSSIPFIIYIVQKDKNKIDLFLPIISIELFVSLYLLINPQIIQIHFLSIILNVLLTTSFISYFVLKLLDYIRKANKKELPIYFARALYVIVIAFIGIAAYKVTLEFSNEMELLQQSNTGRNNMQLTYFLLFIEHLIDALPYLLNAYITNECIIALNKLSKNSYTENLLNTIQKISNMTLHSIYIIIFMNLGLQVLRLFFSSNIYKINLTLKLPIFSIIFLFSVLLVSKIISENIDLKKDNDLFI